MTVPTAPASPTTLGYPVRHARSLPLASMIDRVAALSAVAAGFLIVRNMGTYTMFSVVKFPLFCSAPMPWWHLFPTTRLLVC